MPNLLNLKTAARTDLQDISRFLNENGLPTAGVEKAVENFVLAIDNHAAWIGTAGFELYGESCLLRSVAVAIDYRGKGYGKSLVDAALRNAKARGARTAFLLTETASEYFKRLGFQVIDRKDIDEKVMTSQEFTESCCETATAMRKVLP